MVEAGSEVRWAGVRRAGGRAFTLLELLLAVSITGVIAVVLFASMGTAFDVREQAERRLEGRVALRMALNLLAEDLSAALPPVGVLRSEFRGEDAVGPEGMSWDALSFVSASGALGPEPAMADLSRLDWAVVRDPYDDEGGLLVRGVTAGVPASVAVDPVAQAVLRRVRSFHARYHDGVEWREQWDSADEGDALPAAVELRVTVVLGPAGGGERGAEGERTLSGVRIVRLGCAGRAGPGGGSREVWVGP